MNQYNIEISPAAERDIKNLKNNLSNFKDLVNTIDKLSANPRPYGVVQFSNEIWPRFRLT